MKLLNKVLDIVAYTIVGIFIAASIFVVGWVLVALMAAVWHYDPGAIILVATIAAGCRAIGRVYKNMATTVMKGN